MDSNDQARSNRSLWHNARNVNMACPPASRHRIPERFKRWLTKVLHAASTTPEPMGNC
jgi:hypothetical protein